MQTPNEEHHSPTARMKTKFFLEDLDSQASLASAKLHAAACRIHVISDEYYNNPSKEVETCSCCNLPTLFPGTIDRFTFNTDIRKLSAHGPGLFLYIFFTRMLILIFLALSLSLSLPIIGYFFNFGRYMEDYCLSLATGDPSHPCTSFLKDYSEVIFKISIGGVEAYYRVSELQSLEEKALIIDYSLYNFVFAVVLTFVYLGILILKNYLIKEIDFENTTPSDYTLMISGLRKDLGTVEEVKEELSIDGVTPVEVNMTLKIDVYVNYKQKYLEVEKKIKDLELNKMLKTTSCCMKEVSIKDLQRQRDKLKTEIIKFLKQLDDIKKSKLFTGIVFASFETCKNLELFQANFPKTYVGLILRYCKYFLYKYVLRCLSRSEARRLEKSLNFYVVNAPEPTDIKFENLGFSFWNRVGRGLLTYTVTFVLLSLNLVIIWTIENSQDQSNSSDFGKYFISFLISLAVFVMNLILIRVLKLLNRFEKDHSTTSANLTLSIKLTMFTFINSAVAPLVAVNFSNMQKSETIKRTILLIFLSNVFNTPFSYFFDMNRIKNLFLRRSAIKSLETKGYINRTQRELNQIFQNADIKIADKFGYLGKTTLMTLFYAPVFPLVVVISLISLIVHCFTEILLIKYRYSKPDDINKNIADFYITYFKVGIFLFCLGDYIWLKNSLVIFEYSKINLILGLIILVLPVHLIVPSEFGLLNSNFLKKTWQEVFFMFDTDFARTNPITRNKGLEKYFNKLQENELISKNEYENAAVLFKDTIGNNLHNFVINEVDNLFQQPIRHKSFMKLNSTLSVKSQSNEGSMTPYSRFVRKVVKRSSDFKFMQKVVYFEEPKKENEEVQSEDRELNQMMIEEF